MLSRLLLPVAIMFSCVPSAHAGWEIDPAHSKARFSVSYAGIVPVYGWFANMYGSLPGFNGSDPTTAKLEVVINANSLDTGEPMRDMHLKKGPGFFEVEKYPQIIFKSKSVQRTGTGKFKIVGDLTLHGVTKQISLDASGPTKSFVEQSSGARYLAATATTKLNRKDFKIDWNRELAPGVRMVGDDVEIGLDVVAVERKRKHNK